MSGGHMATSQFNTVVGSYNIGSGGGSAGTSTVNSSIFFNQRVTLQQMADYMRHMYDLQAKQQIQGGPMYGPMANPVPALGSGEVDRRYEEDGETMTVVEVTKPVSKTVDSVEFDIEEYLKLAEIVGISPPDLAIEKFKLFLKNNDIPVYNLKEVVTYMDTKARKESRQQAGWCWKHFRPKDYFGSSFGTRAEYMGGKIRPASDRYLGTDQGTNIGYDKLIPLHALKKVALIDRTFGGTVKMLVCDYEVRPEYRPDPFLMAVIPNPHVHEGHGRFVIDFWNEPGFGLESQLK